MRGDDIERLNIYSRTQIGGPETTLITLASLYPEWTLQEVLLASSAPFQVGY